MHTNQLSKEQVATFNWSHLAGYGYGLGMRTMVDIAKGGSNGTLDEFGWGGAAGASVLIDTEEKLAVFYSHHMLNPNEEYYQPRLRNVVETRPFQWFKGVLQKTLLKQKGRSQAVLNQT